MFDGGGAYGCSGHILDGFGLFLFTILFCLSFVDPTSPAVLPDNTSDCVEMSNGVEENN